MSHVNCIVVTVSYHIHATCHWCHHKGALLHTFFPEFICRSCNDRVLLLHLGQLSTGEGIHQAYYNRLIKLLYTCVLPCHPPINNTDTVA